MGFASGCRRRAGKRSSSVDGRRDVGGSRSKQRVPTDRAARLPRTARLRGDTEFRELFQWGQRIERESFVMLWRGKPGPRATGFMAGRRVGGSVVRNRARRRLREAFRQEQHRLPAVGVRMGFVARRGCIGQAYPLLRAGMASALADLASRLTR